MQQTGRAANAHKHFSPFSRFQSRFPQFSVSTRHGAFAKGGPAILTDRFSRPQQRNQIEATPWCGTKKGEQKMSKNNYFFVEVLLFAAAVSCVALGVSSIVA